MLKECILYILKELEKNKKFQRRRHNKDIMQKNIWNMNSFKKKINIIYL